MEQNERRTRSFRYEDYNRRAFSRSYHLHRNGGEDREGSEEEADGVVEASKGQRPTKKIILSVMNWGEDKVLVLRRVKIKLTVYIIVCVPVGRKPYTALVSS